VIIALGKLGRRIRTLEARLPVPHRKNLSQKKKKKKEKKAESLNKTLHQRRCTDEK
jgi:hypothetical protein